MVTFPDSQSIAASGALPAGGRSVVLNEPVGGDGAGMIVVEGARRVQASVSGLQRLQVQLRFWHFVDFGGRLVPDALLPWDGGVRPTEEPNQPLSIEVSVPYGTRPGSYRGAVRVAADARSFTVPVQVTIYPVQLPRPGQVAGSLPAVFGIGPQAYVNRAIQLYHLAGQQIRAANDALFSLLSAYRLSPDSWGYGIPNNPAGYTAAPDAAHWWLDKPGFMLSEVAHPFSMLWIPLSNNRAGAADDIAHLSPDAPQTWCGYLQSVRRFWAAHGLLATGAIPYVYPYDEPGYTQTDLLARQASVVHRCFAGAKVLVTANPSPAPAELRTLEHTGTTGNTRLYDGKGSDDIDIWSVVDWRYYGLFTPIGMQKQHIDRTRMYERAIDQASRNGKEIFTFTYYGPPGIPSLRATEPLTDPRMFVLWAALEHIQGILYGEGMTTYGAPGNPLSSVADGGESVLLYPGPQGPIPSARLEQIRDGIEDWELLDIVRRHFGQARVRTILGQAGLFSADAQGVELSCLVGCDLKGPTPYAWPQWSHDQTTPTRIETARLAALRLASS